MMGINNHLTQWIPTEVKAMMRYAPPFLYEQAAAAGGAAQFAAAITKLTDQIDQQESDPVHKAHAIAVAAAVVNDFVQATAERTGTEVTPDLEEKDDPPPEILQARHTMEYCQGMTAGLLERAKIRMKEVPDQPTIAEPHELRVLAETASHTGHAIALSWHIDAIMNPDLDEETKAGHVLAMWPHEQHASRPFSSSDHGHQDSGHQDSGHQHDAAVALLQSATQRMKNPRILLTIEECRPIQVSPGADQELVDGRIQDLISSMTSMGPDGDASYSWDNEDTAGALIAYHYQGCTHAKLLSEPYQHPIDTATCLQHCNDLEELVLTLLSESDDDEPNDAHLHTLLHQAVLNRSMALTHLNVVPAPYLDHLVEMLKDAIPERTRIKAMLRAVCDDHAEIMATLTMRHQLDGPVLNDQQAAATVEAAQAAGADTHTLRDMALRLGIDPLQMTAIGIPKPSRINWAQTRSFLEHLYSVQPDSRQWHRVAATMGWSMQTSEIQGLWLELETMGPAQYDDPQEP